jgi:hypothetical protein
MNLITTIPFEINSQGVWGLALSFDAWNLPPGVPAITINASDVMLLGNGQRLINSGGFNKQDIGIYAKNRARLHVSGHTIFGSGWRYPIYLETDYPDSAGRHTVTDNPRLSGNFRGMRVEGADNIIARNGIYDIGGATWHPDIYAMGIETLGPRARVLDNIIKRIRGTDITGESVGISATAEIDGTIIRNNLVENDERLDRSMGIWTGYGTDCRILDNVFGSFKRCVWGTTTTGEADGNRDYDCGPLDGQDIHPLYDMPSPQWTGGNI